MQLPAPEEAGGRASSPLPPPRPGPKLLNKPGMVAHTWPPSTLEMEAGPMDVQGQPQLQKELGVSLGYMRPCVKKKLKTK